MRKHLVSSVWVSFNSNMKTCRLSILVLVLVVVVLLEKTIARVRKKQLPAGKQKDELVPKPRHKTS